MIREQSLYDLNPWWRGSSKIDEDRQIKEWLKSGLNYEPKLKREIEYDADDTVVYTLRGPRQVGKTTLIKLQIRDFLSKGVGPWSILYYSHDVVDTKQDVVDLIELYMRMSQRHRGESRSYIFLDEVSSIPDWQKGIKWLVDSDKLKNCTVMATGSQSINIKNATERLPGRRGRIEGSYDKILLPMAFSEFAVMQSDEIRQVITQNKLSEHKDRTDVFEQLITGEIDERLDDIGAYKGDLDNLLHEYMITGGTPRVINEKSERGIIAENTYASYLEGITGQWNKLGKSEALLKQFGEALTKSLPNHTSWHSLYKRAELGSSNTAAEYTHTLQDLFVLHGIQHYSIKNKMPAARKERKFYFSDPFFIHVFNGWIRPGENFKASLNYLEDEKNQGIMAESIVADHLIRRAFSSSKKQQMFDYNGHIMYWKDNKNREVDFILYDGGKIELPIEVKFRNSFGFRELAPLTKFLDATGGKQGLVISKYSFEVREEYTIIPASLFLLLM